jgi:hypothetical protein
MSNAPFITTMAPISKRVVRITLYDTVEKPLTMMRMVRYTLAVRLN